MAYKKNNTDRTNEPIEFEIVEHIANLTVYQTGWVKELNIVAWNNGAPKFDIREWSPDHERMSKGITLFEDEAKKLADGLKRHFGMANKPEVRTTPIETETNGGEAA